MIKKSIIGIFVVLGLLELLTVFLLPSLIRKDEIRAEITNSFKQLTGLDLEIQGDINVMSFPAPHVVINFLDAHNAAGAISPFLLEIKRLEVWPSIPSLFRNRLVIDKMTISGADVELERMKNNQMSWKDSTLQASATGMSISSVFSSTEISVDNAVVRYTDTPANTAQEFDDISGVFVNEGEQKEKSLRVALRYKDRPFVISGHMGDLLEIPASGTVPADLTVKSGKSSLTYTGDIGFKDGDLFIKGRSAFDTDDMVPLLNLLLGRTAKKAIADSHYKPLPLKASSDIATEDKKIIFPGISLEGEAVKGNIQAVVTMSGHVDIKALISEFDLEALVASGLFDIDDNAGSETMKDDSGTTIPALPSKSIWSFLTFSADIAFADTLYNGQHIKDAHFTFDTSDGEVNIPQASAVLPGDSRVVFTGIGKEGYQGFAFEGEIDAAGSDFAAMLTIFKSRGLALPAGDFRRFRMKANAVISARDMRLSEIAARIENMALVGGAVATFGKRTKLVAALRIDGVNLDHFVTLWGLEEWRTSFLEDSLVPKKEEFLSQWLKHLGYDISLNTSLEQYVLNGRVRDKTDFKMEATTGSLMFKNVRTSYNGSQFQGDVGINVSEALPRLNLDITADTVDTAVLLSPDGKPPATAPQETKGERWTHDQLDFHWLTLLNATYHLKFGHFRHGPFQADALDIKGRIDEHTLDIDSLTAVVLGTETLGRMSISGGKIPEVNLAASVKGISVDRLFFLFPVLQGMTGKYNIDMRLSTNGTDTFSWISNLNGTIGIGGRDITIHGFNLPGIISAVSYVRTVADILDVVKRAWPGGDTLFPTIQGEWVVTNGTLKAASMVLTSPYSEGIVQGDVDLIDWKIQSSITFTLKPLDPDHPPSIIASYSGDLDAPERMLDTRSLEQYVTNKTSERMLEQYGTH